MTRTPIPDEVWDHVRILRDRLRELHGVRLTYAQIGSSLGVSASRVKQKLQRYEYYVAPGGRYSMRPARKADDVANTSPGVGESGIE